MIGSQAPNTQFRSQNTMKIPQSNASQVTTNNNNARVCFNKPAASAFSNSVNGPRPVLSGANRVPIRNNNNNIHNNSQQMRQPQQSFG